VARKLKIDRAVYLVDDDRRTYSFLKRNPDWTRLSPRQNAANKLQIDGYVRLFRDGRKKTFRAGRTPSWHRGYISSPARPIAPRKQSSTSGR
jgi:hypothetical protein